MNAQLEDHTAALLEAAIAGRYPDARGRYGPFGGRYVPETLVAPLERLAAACSQLRERAIPRRVPRGIGTGPGVRRH